jgi:hypothetical protein
MAAILGRTRLCYAAKLSSHIEVMFQELGGPCRSTTLNDVCQFPAQRHLRRQVAKQPHADSARLCVATKARPHSMCGRAAL